MGVDIHVYVMKHDKASNKYEWLKNIKIQKYILDRKELFFNKTVKENGLKDNSVIRIIEE